LAKAVIAAARVLIAMLFANLFACHNRHTYQAIADVDARFRAPRRSHADARLCRNARGRNGGIRKGLAAGMI
jgi:hypothetical protein